MTRALRSEERFQTPILAMAQPSHLEQRLVALLNPSLNRLAATPWAVLVVAGVAIALTLPLAAVRTEREVPIAAAAAILPSPAPPAVSPVPVVAETAPLPVKAKASSTLAALPPINDEALRVGPVAAVPSTELMADLLKTNAAPAAPPQPCPKYRPRS